MRDVILAAAGAAADEAAVSALEAPWLAAAGENAAREAAARTAGEAEGISRRHPGKLSFANRTIQTQGKLKQAAQTFPSR